MCRWLAYHGPSIWLEDILFKAEHSLIDQSLSSQSKETATNGDGFGVGWYGGRNRPGRAHRADSVSIRPDGLRAHERAQMTRAGRKPFIERPALVLVQLAAVQPDCPGCRGGVQFIVVYDRIHGLSRPWLVPRLLSLSYCSSPIETP